MEVPRPLLLVPGGVTISQTDEKYFKEQFNYIEECLGRAVKIHMELIFEGMTNKTYFKVYGLDSHGGKVHVLTATLFYGSPCCDLKNCLTCHGCLPCKQCASCTLCSRFEFSMVLESPDGTIIGKVSDVGSALSSFVGTQTVAFAADAFAGRSGPDREGVCPCCMCVDRAEYAIYNKAEEKIYTTICRCNVLDLICGCCKSCCCDVVLLEMYSPADSSLAFTLTEKCTIHRLILPIFCMGRVINYEIDKRGTEYPHGIFPIVQACMGVAAKAHFYTRLRNVENAPLKSVLGGRANL